MSTEDDADNPICIIDFGLSKTTFDIQSQTIVQGLTIVGTPGYMSPDQIRGLEYDARSEIYSLGCIMYEALTGRQPYSGETALDVLNNHLLMPLPPVSSIEPAISEELCDIVERCLSKERELRYGSASEVSEDLRSSVRIRSAECVEEQSVSPDEAFKVGSKVFWRTAAALTIVAIGLLVSFPLYLYNCLSTTEPVMIRTYQSEMTIANSPTGFLNESAYVKSLKNQNGDLSFSHDLVLSDFKLISKLRPRSIQFSGCGGLNDEALQELSKVSSINTLRFYSCELTPKGVSYLARLPMLSYLSFYDSNLNNECLFKLKNARNLVTLNLVRNEITREGLAHLAGRPKLLSVRVDQALLKTIPASQLSAFRGKNLAVRGDSERQRVLEEEIIRTPE